MTGFLSPDELAQMRADQDRTLLDETCTILTPTATVDSIGEAVLSWGTVAAGVACRLRPSGQTAGLRTAYGQMFPTPGQTQAIAPWTVTLPAGTTVNPRDRIVVDAVTYEVIQSWDDATWATGSRVQVERIES